MDTTKASAQPAGVPTLRLEMQNGYATVVEAASGASTGLGDVDLNDDPAVGIRGGDGVRKLLERMVASYNTCRRVSMIVLDIAGSYEASDAREWYDTWSEAFQYAPDGDVKKLREDYDRLLAGRGKGELQVPAIDTATLTRDERSLLLYAETCVVDSGGLLVGARMNTDDIAALKKFSDLGILSCGRIPWKLIPKLMHPGPGMEYTHYVTFTDAAWSLVSRLRRERAERSTSNNRKKVDQALAERIGSAP